MVAKKKPDVKGQRRHCCRAGSYWRRRGSLYERGRAFPGRDPPYAGALASSGHVYVTLCKLMWAHCWLLTIGEAFALAIRARLTLNRRRREKVCVSSASAASGLVRTRRRTSFSPRRMDSAISAAMVHEIQN